jgi:hypothetical protein
MSLAPSRPAVRTRWHYAASSLPPDTDAAPPTPFHTRAWATAWESVTTEQVLSRRYLELRDARGAHRLAYHLVDTSPFWESMASQPGTAAPVWDQPVLYAPSLYGEYGGLPGAGRHILAEAVDAGLRLAREHEAPALVVTNLPPRDLDQGAAARTPDATVTLYWAHRASVGGSLADFVQRIPTSKVRVEFGRQHRRGTDAGLTLRVLHGPDIRQVLPVFTAQARTTSERHGPALYGEDLLGSVADVPGAVVLLAEHPSGVAGGFLCFLHRDVFYMWAAGIDQDRKNSLHTYGWLTAEAIAYAARCGATVIDSGRSNYLYKQRIGLHAQPLTSAVYLTRPDTRLAARINALDTSITSHVHAIWNR